jgi:hypothetical protein
MIRPLLLALLTAGLVGCVSMTASSPQPPFEPEFNFTPPETAEPGAAGVTLAVIQPHYAEARAWAGISPFRDLPTGLAADFSELLNARGFMVRGPFEDYGRMLYPDKSGSDLVLVPVLHIDVAVEDVERSTTELLTGAVKQKGRARLSGRVSLLLLESITGTRMWAKDIPVAARSVSWIGEKFVDAEQLGNVRAIYQDPGFIRAVGPELEDLYSTVMQTAWDFLNPDELRLVKEQSIALRK